MQKENRRFILHCDLDAFFASIEELDFPELKGKPVVVGGSAEGRGVVSTANYEARKYGIHSAMPMVQALKLCKNLIRRDGRFHRYSEISEQVFEIFSRFTPEVEGISIDEAFLDVTGCEMLFGDAISIAKEIKNCVKNEIGITISVGVAPNKFIAKLASEIDKPDGLTVAPFDRQELIKWLEPMPIRRMWGIGKETEKKFKTFNMNKIGDLQKATPEFLKKYFGVSGLYWHNLALGIDEREVTTEHGQARSLSHETTFAKDVKDVTKLKNTFFHLAEKVGSRLRKHGLVGKTVHIKYRHGDFTTFTRAKTLAQLTNSTDLLFQSAWEVFQLNWTKKPLRLIGIAVTNLTSCKKQLTLFDDSVNKLDDAIDKVRGKFGDDSIIRACQMKKDTQKAPDKKSKKNKNLKI